MAWPLSRFRDHIANTTVIGADLLNAVQDKIVALFSGTLTVKSLVIDGTGGASSSPAAGEIHVSRVVADSNEPSGAATNKGQLYKESCPTTKAAISGGFATVTWGFGVYSVTRNGNGDYTVVCKEIPSGGPTAARSVVHITPTTDVAHDYIAVTKDLDGSNRLRLNVIFKNAAADIDFDLTVTVM